VTELAIIYGDELLSYDFGPGHPLRQIRVKMAMELMEDLGLLAQGGVRVVPPRPAKEGEILLFHERSYVEYVKMRSKEGRGLLDHGDTPAFKGCFEASVLVVGATLKAVEEALRGGARFSANLAGGLHHAHPNRASGFCIFNDAAIALAYLLTEGFDRLAYIDVDAHHGDGVMYGFYSDGRILDVDFHEDGRYLFPGTGSVDEIGRGEGRGLKVNIPLPPSSGDDVFVEAFRRLVPKLLAKFKPEYIILQCGADGYVGDPLAHLSYTTHAYEYAVRELAKWSERLCEGRLTLLGGGGYSYENAARVWSLACCILAGYEEGVTRLKDASPTTSPPEIRGLIKANLDKLERMLSDPSRGERGKNPFK